MPNILSCFMQCHGQDWGKQVVEMMISLGYILSHYKIEGGAKVCIVLDKWVCQTFIYGYIVTKYGCNSLKYIISQGDLYYFTFNIRLLVKFWMWSKIQSNFGPNVTSELLVRSGSESGRYLVWQIFLNGFLFFCKVFYLNNYI